MTPPVTQSLCRKAFQKKKGGCEVKMRVNRFLLERILRQSLAANLEVFHIGRHLTTEVLVNIELGKILSQHETMTAQTGAEAHLRVMHSSRGCSCTHHVADHALIT